MWHAALGWYAIKFGQMSAILEFYLWFWFRPYHRRWRYITGTLRCLQKKMATYRHWSVSLWRDPDDVSHCRIPSPDKTEWRLISATLCGWGRCFVADQLCLMTRIREEEEDRRWHVILHQSAKCYPNRTAHSRKITSCRFSRRQISAVLDFRGHLKSPCTTSYRSTMETIVVKLLSFWENRVFAFWRQTDRQTNGQAPVAWSCSRCRERRLNIISNYHIANNGLCFGHTQQQEL